MSTIADDCQLQRQRQQFHRQQTSTVTLPRINLTKFSNVTEHCVVRLLQLLIWLTSVSQTHTHTHPFNGHLSGTTQVSQYQKGKTNLDFTEARDSEWQWHQLGHRQVCTSLQTDNHVSTHHSVSQRVGISDSGMHMKQSIKAAQHMLAFTLAHSL